MGRGRKGGRRARLGRRTRHGSTGGAAGSPLQPRPGSTTLRRASLQPRRSSIAIPTKFQRPFVVLHCNSGGTSLEPQPSSDDPLACFTAASARFTTTPTCFTAALAALHCSLTNPATLHCSPGGALDVSLQHHTDTAGSIAAPCRWSFTANVTTTHWFSIAAPAAPAVLHRSTRWPRGSFTGAPPPARWCSIAGRRRSGCYDGDGWMLHGGDGMLRRITRW